jgi:hypothetical protein
MFKNRKPHAHPCEHFLWQVFWLIFLFWTIYASGIEVAISIFHEIVSFILKESLHFGNTCWFVSLLLVHCAAQLPLFFPICFFFKSPLHLCVCNIVLVHQVSHGWRLSYSVEGIETLSCFSSTNDILFYCSLVCWWTHRISYISHQHKPGWSFCLIVYPNLLGSERLCCGGGGGVVYVFVYTQFFSSFF